MNFKKGTKVKHINDGTFHSNEEGYVYRSEVESRNLGYRGIMISKDPPEPDHPYHMIWIADPTKIKEVEKDNSKYFFWLLIIVFFYIIFTATK